MRCLAINMSDVCLDENGLPVKKEKSWYDIALNMSIVGG